MEYGSVKEKKVHPALVKERQACNFDKKELEYYLGQNVKQGPAWEKWFETLREYIEKDPVL